MISTQWLFCGFLTGMIIAVVFRPPVRKNPKIPTPNTDECFHTDSGCVKFTTTEVNCVKDTGLSLNTISDMYNK
jgi:hypothetical protein